MVTEAEKIDVTEFYLIKGHAGSGKSVLLRRLAWDAAVEFRRLCLLLNSSSYPEYEPLFELYNFCKERIFLFVDSISKHSETIENFITRARKDKLPLTIIGTERGNIWNTNCEHLEAYLTDEYELKYLSQKEIEKLIELLTRHNSLGYLQGLTSQEQKDALSKKAGRQLLVALHEATLGKPFSDIVLDEYRNIGSPQAQSLYLTVCMLHRLGVDTRAGLVSRIHGIPFEKFKEQLFHPLEYIVFAVKDKAIGDYVYRSRHPHIAEIVFERVLVDHQDKFDEFVRIIRTLDIGYASDSQALKSMINAKELQVAFSDSHMIRQIYKTASDRFEDEPALMQQEGIFEMTSPNGSMEKATLILQKAYSISHKNRAIAHSLSELALKKAENSTNLIERKIFRNEARKIAREIIDRGNVSSHPYHTLIKTDTDELSELLELENDVVIENKIKEIEKMLAHALQLFPTDSYILDAESKFSELINNNPKALESLKKAFAVNKRNPYIASRLARMYETNAQVSDAINVLKECLEENPGDKSINFKLAMLLSHSSDPNDPNIKHYLRRSFTEGDSNVVTQFWYARLVYLEGDFDEAYKMFKNLGNYNMDIRIKKEPRGKVKNIDGTVKKYYGSISALESSYGFVIRDGDQQKIFLHILNGNENVWSQLGQGRRVSFELAFNYRGPCALEVKLEDRPS